MSANLSTKIINPYLRKNKIEKPLRISNVPSMVNTEPLKNDKVGVISQGTAKNSADELGKVTQGKDIRLAKIQQSTPSQPRKDSKTVTPPSILSPLNFSSPPQDIKSTDAKSQKSKVTKRLSASQSLKLHLKKEILALKKNKQLQQRKVSEKDALNQKLELQKKREDEKHQREIEKEKAKQEKLLESKVKKEKMKEKLQQDLEKRLVLEKERLERKEKLEQERLDAKMERIKRKEEEKKLEIEKRRLEVEQILRELHEKQLNDQNRFIQNTPFSSMTSNLLEPNKYVPFQPHYGFVNNYHLQSSSPYPLTQYGNSFNLYQYPTSMQSYPNCTPQINPIFNRHPFLLHRFENITNNSSSSIKTMTNTTKTESINKMSPKSMILSKDPLDSNSPYSKSHVLLTYTFSIYKEDRDGETFGVDIRYDSRGTFIDVATDDESNPIEKSQSVSYPKDYDLSIVSEKSLNSNDQNFKTSTPSMNVYTLENSEEMTFSNGQNQSVSEMTTETGNQYTGGGSTSMNSNIGEGNITMQNDAGVQKLDVPHNNSSFTNENKKKTKKKRHVVGVMTVVGAKKQNDRVMKFGDRKQETLLQSGDIILSIDGQSITDGLSFQDACALFAKCQNKKTISIPGESECKDGNEEFVSSNYEVIECNVTIAREKKVLKILEKLSALDKPIQTPLPKKKSLTSKDKSHTVQNDEEFVDAIDSMPLKSLEKQADSPKVIIPFSVNEGEFTLTEYKSLVFGLLETTGRIVPQDLEMTDIMSAMFDPILNHPDYCDKLVRRDVDGLMGKWMCEVSNIDNEYFANALLHWKKQWKSEQNTTPDDLSLEYLSESHRSRMRMMPKPPRGCKCGSTKHDYVNDSSCPLYRNLRKMIPPDTLNEISMSKSKKFQIDKTKLNKLGAAHVQRMQKLQEEEEARESEALFVNKMEEFQVFSLKVAVVAPRLLSVILLSAIASLNETLPSRSTQDKDAIIETHHKSMSDESIDEKLDRPQDSSVDILKSAGEKRISNNVLESPSDTKRQKKEHCTTTSVLQRPNPFYMAKLIHFLSYTWGHVYQEPEVFENAWIDECKREACGINESSLNTSQREPGVFPFETAQFTLNDKIMDRLHNVCGDKEEIDLDDLHYLSAIVHLMSDLKTGVMSEILFLINQGIVRVNNRSGYLELNSNWEEKVPLMILNDMWEMGWSCDIDNQNLFCLHNELRVGLAKRWKRTNEGWALLGKDDYTMIHRHEIYQSRRDLFEERFQNRMNEIDGIAQFGI